MGGGGHCGYRDEGHGAHWGSAADYVEAHRAAWLAARGLTNGRIGRELWITEQTVKFHLSNIYRKLGVVNRTEASRVAHLGGLMEPEPERTGEPVHLAVA